MLKHTLCLIPSSYFKKLGALSEGFHGARTHSEKRMSHQNIPPTRTMSQRPTWSITHTETHTILLDSYLTFSPKSPKCGFIVSFIKIRLFLVLFLDFIKKYLLGKCQFWPKCACSSVPTIVTLFSGGQWGVGCCVKSEMCLHGVFQRFMTGNTAKRRPCEPSRVTML